MSIAELSSKTNRQGEPIHTANIFPLQMHLSQENGDNFFIFCVL